MGMKGKIYKTQRTPKVRESEMAISTKLQKKKIFFKINEMTVLGNASARVWSRHNMIRFLVDLLELRSA